MLWFASEVTLLNCISGPLRMGRKTQFWQRLKSLSRGSVTEHVPFIEIVAKIPLDFCLSPVKIATSTKEIWSCLVLTRFESFYHMHMYRKCCHMNLLVLKWEIYLLLFYSVLGVLVLLTGLFEEIMTRHSSVKRNYHSLWSKIY